MSAKHTPGPWTAVPNGGDDEDPRAVLVAVRDQYGDWTVLADCRNRWLADDVSGDEEANARLVAAAPDMLEALEHAKWWIETTCQYAHEEGTSVDSLASGKTSALKPILAAIAKATGEAP
jgi:hypothetical protein